MNSTELVADMATVDPSSSRLQVALGPNTTPLNNRPSEAAAGHEKLSGRVLLPYIDGPRDVVERSDESGLLAAVAACKQQSDCLPAQLLDALRKTSKRPLQQQLKKAAPCPPPSNLWNFPHRRTKLKHLTDNPPCLSGAGKDISFLHDASELPYETKDSQLPDTLIPEEYHIVRDPGVLGLEIHDDKYTTRLEDKDQLLRVFPSSRPAGRKEVVVLKNVMDNMLEKAGVEDSTTEPMGPTQIHRLCELVKQEQAIYNLVFHELIRQTSVQCSERGQLLALLRQKYAGLLDRVPKQVMNLHDEVLAQRALDRRLTAELNRFQTNISKLTDELQDVMKHDTEVSQQASEAQQNLEAALVESEKNANLVAEYHDLYEMHRHRLDIQVTQLASEKDLWRKAAHSLAAKVANQRSLKTMQRLQLSEKTWSRLAAHFAVVLSDCDSQQMSELQSYVQTCHEMLSRVEDALVEQDGSMKSRLSEMLAKMRSWKQQVSAWLEEGRNCNHMTVKELWLDVKLWEETVSQQAETFTGDSVLDWQEKLVDINKQVSGWTDTAILVFNRHRMPGESEPRKENVKMLQLNEEMQTCLIQRQIRVSGENGLAKILIHLVSPLETWAAKLNLASSGSHVFPDSEWQKLAEQLDDWVNHVEDAVNRVGLHVKDNVPVTDEVRKESVSVRVLLTNAVQWMKSMCNSIDTEDCALVEQVNVLHADMVEWMVHVLLRLTEEEVEDESGNKEDGTPGGEEEEESRLKAEKEREPLKSTVKIKSMVDTLTHRINVLTTQLNKCCTDVLQEQLQVVLGLSGEESAERELRDLQRMGSECEQWTQTAGLLVGELNAKDVGLWTPPSWHDLRKSDPLARKQHQHAQKLIEQTAGTIQNENKTTERLSVQVIGSDDNVSEMPLETVVIDKDETTGSASPSVAALASDTPLPPGRSGLPHDALLSAVEELKQQLKECETRAVTAEERVSKAEEKLRLANEQIEGLEQREQQLQQDIKRQQQQLNQQQQSPRRGVGPPSRGATSRQGQGGKRTPMGQQTRRGTPDTQGSSPAPGGARK